MKYEVLKHAFDAAHHAPQVTDYLHSLLRLRFRENGFDIGTSVRPTLHRVLIKMKMEF